MKKFLPVFLTLIILSGSVFIQYDKAYAAGSSVEAALSSGQAGVSAAAMYMTYALTVAAGAGALGSQYSDQIKQQATNVWNATSSTTKSVWNTTVTSALAAGKKTVSITQDMANDLKAAFAGSGAWLSSLLSTAANSSIGSPLLNAPSNYNYILFNDSSYWYVLIYDQSKSLVPSMNGSMLDLTNNGTSSVTVTCYKESKSVFSNPDYNGMSLPFTAQITIGLVPFGSYSGLGIDYDSKNPPASVSVPSGTTLDGVMTNNLDSLANGTNEIDLPLDQFIYKDGAGNILDWNPASNTWEHSDGSVYTGDVAVDYPVAGVDSTAGVTYANPSITLDKVDVAGETTFPDGGGSSGSDDTSSINWSKLLTAFSSLTDVFPFSIPWDVQSLFSVLNVAPVTPVYHIDVSKDTTIMGVHIPISYKYDIDFSPFNDVAAIGRWALVLIWDIAIILALRRLTPD